MSRENKEKAQIILQLIATSGMRHKAIAATLCCDRITVARWASDKTPTAPSDARLAQLRSILAVRVEWLLRGVASITEALASADPEAATQVARQAAPAAMDLAAFLAKRADEDRDARREAWALVKNMMAAGLTADQVRKSIEFQRADDGGFVLDPRGQADRDATAPGQTDAYIRGCATDAGAPAARGRATAGGVKKGEPPKDGAVHLDAEQVGKIQSMIPRAGRSWAHGVDATMPQDQADKIEAARAKIIRAGFSPQNVQELLGFGRGKLRAGHADAVAAAAEVLTMRAVASAALRAGGKVEHAADDGDGVTGGGFDDPQFPRGLRAGHADAVAAVAEVLTMRAVASAALRAGASEAAQ